MATDVERLIVRLEVSQARFERQMANMSNVANRRAKQVESRFAAMNANLSRQFNGLGPAIAGAFAIGASLRGAQQLMDAATRIKNALNVAGLEGAEMTSVYDRLFESAQRNGAPIEALVTLYSRMSTAQKELNATGDELLQFTDLVAMSLRASGQSATEAQGALLQLSQALGGGVVQAEEYNSLLDGARPLLQAVAAGIKEAGGSVSELTRLVKDGQVSSEAFFRGGQAGAQVLERQLAGAETTVSSALVRLQNVLIDTGGKFDEASDGTARLVNLLDDLSAWIKQTDFGPLINGIFNVGQAAVESIEKIMGMARALGELTGANQIGEWARGRYGEKQINDRVARAFDDTAGDGAEGGVPKNRRGEPLQVDISKPVRQISLSDYAAPAKAGAGKGRGGSKRTPEENFQRDIDQIRERTAAVQAETAAMGALNPLIDDYGFALERTRAEQDLLTAAKRAGIAVTPQLREQIATLATGYATASVEANKLAESQDEIRERAEDMRALGKDVMGGFIDDMKGGVTATEALANALDKVGSKLLDIALDGLFSSKSGSGGGLFAGLASMVGGKGFASGTANTGGRRGEARGVVHGQEAVIPLPAGGKVPVDVRLPTMAARGGGGIADVRVSIDQNGNLQAYVERVSGGVSAKAVGAYDRNLDRTIGVKMAGARTMNRAGTR